MRGAGGWVVGPGLQNQGVDSTGTDDWRRTVGRYLADSTTNGSVYTPLAVRFELREFVPRNRHRWNGPLTMAVKTMPVRGLGRQHRLAGRPVARTGRGWAQGSLTWSNLPHQQNRLQLDPTHHRWCCEFGALYRAVAPTNPTRDADWVFLDDFGNPALWTLLDQAAAHGVALLGSGPTGLLRRSSNATVTLNATGGDSGITLASRLVVEGVVMPTTGARPIGRHGVYAVAGDNTITVAPTSATLTAEQVGLLGTDGVPTVSIPGSEVDEFFGTYLPGLRRGLEVSSADGSVVLPEPPPAVLLISVTHVPRHVVELTTEWDDRGGGRRPSLAELGVSGLLPNVLTEPEAEPARPVRLQDVDAAEFVTTVLPTLARLSGVRVEVHGQSPNYRELTGTPQLAISVVPAEKADWFSLGVTVTVAGRVIPFTQLFTALARGRRTLLLVDGSYLSLRHPALQELSDLIAESLDLEEWEPLPTLSRHQMVTIWPDFEDLAEESAAAAGWRALLVDLDPDTAIETAPPDGLRAILRPYQQTGFSWLAHLWRHRLGGILADDMGLGKTLQTLALIQHAKQHDRVVRPFLIVAPTSVVPNWPAEAARFAPGLTVRSMTGTESTGAVAIAELAADADILVTSYALLRLDFDAYQAVATSTGWAGLVLDEAQFVKNPTAAIHLCALELSVPFKLAITGTPLENSLTDLHALFSIVAPGLFPSAPKFQRRYVRPIEQPMVGIAGGVGAGTAPQVAERVRRERLAALRRRIRPFLLRRTKDRVAAELPVRQEQVLRVELGPEHRAVYDRYLQRERRKVLQLLDDEEKNNKFIMFRSLTLLRLLALHAGLVDTNHDGLPSTKLAALRDRLAGVIAEGHRALVFSQFTSFLGKVAAQLDRDGIRYAYLDGSTRNRRQVVDEFRKGTAPVFLMSLKAGGLGLNLTEADYVFLLDPWWNPAAERQAIDRTHRIGQTRNVLVYRLVAADTIEEKVMALQRRKATLFDVLFSGDAADTDQFGHPLSPDDIRELFT